MKTWVERLSKQYSTGVQQLEKYRDHLLAGRDPDKIQDEKLKAELDIVSGMIADMHYAIDWMRTGRRPRQRRGVDIHDAYKRASLMDMDIFPSLDLETQESRITDEQKKRIVRVLMVMSNRERQCYLLHMAHGLSMAEIGEELKIKKATVQVNVRRAKAKVQQVI